MICSVCGVPIYYEQYGEGQPVLCIHGYSADHRLMTGCLEPIFADIPGFKRIYPDLPGMGKTPAAPWIQNADDILVIMKEFIQAVIPSEKFLIAGKSYGGYLTLGLIRDIPEKIEGVLLICPVVVNENRKLPAKHTLIKTDHIEMIADNANMDSFLDMAVVATPETYQKYENNILAGIKISDSDFLSRYSRQGYKFSFECDLLNAMSFDKPTCILTGRQDHVVGYYDAFEISAKFPRATYVILDCSGHNLEIESEELFNQHVRDWIRRIKLSTCDI